MCRLCNRQQGMQTGRLAGSRQAGREGGNTAVNIADACLMPSPLTHVPYQNNYCSTAACTTYFRAASSLATSLYCFTFLYRWTWIWRTTVRQIFAYDGRYAWTQSDAYQVLVICIRQILHMTDQFSWSHWVRHIQVHLYINVYLHLYYIET